MQNIKIGRLLLTNPQGQWYYVPNLGFCILFGSLTLATVNSYKK